MRLVAFFGLLVYNGCENMTSAKHVKIADMICNTKTPPELGKKESIERKIVDAETFYIPLGLEIDPIMIKELINNIETDKRSDHYKHLFVPTRN